MEKMIIASLDNLTVEQTERLLKKTIKIKISGRDRDRIKNSILEKTGFAKKRLYLYKRLAACAVAFAVILTSLSVAGFDNVAAAISKIFTFLPGVGIVERSSAPLYTIDPIIGKIEAQNAKAAIVRAIYADGCLSVIVSVSGKDINRCDFIMYINENPLDFNNEIISDNESSCMVKSSDLSMLHLSFKTAEPSDSDLYEIAVTGFSERLSFKMAACRDYDDLKQIGPTDTQNGISVTTTANSIDDKLIIWCYPFYTAGTTHDSIVGYGNAVNAAWTKKKYIETEKSVLYENGPELYITGRLVFDKLEKDQTAVLHIPYLAMLRKEKKKLRVTLPEGYSTVTSDASVKCSLGTIRITEINRAPSVYTGGKDTIRLKFAFDSNDDNKMLNSFDFQIIDQDDTTSFECNEQSGCLSYIETDVERDETKLHVDISGLYYYLLGEYVIPLDIQ